MKHPKRMTCEEVFRRLDDFVDRQLGPAERRDVERHLESCTACAAEYRFEASLLAELRAKLRRIRLPERLLADVTAQIERRAKKSVGN